MASTITLTAQPRAADSRPRALRRAQLVPGVLYGPQFDSRSLQFNTRELGRVLREAGTSALIELSIDGTDGNEIILIRDIQRDPVTRAILHVDLYRTQADVAIRLQVPLVQHGEAPVLEIVGAYINTQLDELEIECLPGNVPSAITVDLTRLVDMESAITVADLDIPEGVTVLTPIDSDVVRPAYATMEVEEEEVEELELGEEELVEGAEGAEEEEAPAAEEDGEEE